MGTRMRLVNGRICLGMTLALVLLLPGRGHGQVVEAGGLVSAHFVLSDGTRPNAAARWALGGIPTVRVEQWWKEQERWKFGAVLLPFYFKTDQRLSADLAVKGHEFASGEVVTLKYQFHNLRGTASYRAFSRPRTSFRVGGSLILRYAELNVSDGSQAGKNTNVIAFPLVHLEYRTLVSEQLALLVRGDTLPFGLRQGLYDVLIAVEGAAEARKGGPRFSAGLRFFWGGFSPHEIGQNNNEMVFFGPVLRIGF